MNLLWTQLKSEGQEEEAKKNLKSRYQTIFGTILIAISGCILYLDKVLEYIGYVGTINSNYYSYSAFVWTMCQTISPLLIIFGANFKPLRIAYTIPLYCYCLQVYYVFFDLEMIEKEYTPYYAIGTAIGIYFLIIALRNFFNYLISIKDIEVELLESIIESDKVILDKHGIDK